MLLDMYAVPYCYEQAVFITYFSTAHDNRPLLLPDGLLLLFWAPAASDWRCLQCSLRLDADWPLAVVLPLQSRSQWRGRISLSSLFSHCFPSAHPKFQPQGMNDTRKIISFLFQCFLPSPFFFFFSCTRDWAQGCSTTEPHPQPLMFLFWDTA